MPTNRRRSTSPHSRSTATQPLRVWSDPAEQPDPHRLASALVFLTHRQAAQEGGTRPPFLARFDKLADLRPSLPKVNTGTEDADA